MDNDRRYTPIPLKAFSFLRRGPGTLHAVTRPDRFYGHRPNGGYDVQTDRDPRAGPGGDSMTTPTPQAVRLARRGQDSVLPATSS